jgi:hypothetical protein
LQRTDLRWNESLDPAAVRQVWDECQQDGSYHRNLSTKFWHSFHFILLMVDTILIHLQFMMESGRHDSDVYISPQGTFGRWQQVGPG